MKPFILFIVLFNFGVSSFAQSFQLRLIGNTVSENKIIDSINYNKTHKNTKAIVDEINMMSEKLSEIGFIGNQILENIKENDSAYFAKFSLGEKIKSIHIYIGVNPSINELIENEKTKDTIFLPYGETESFLNQTLQKLEKKGYALAKLKLVNIKTKKQTLYADLEFESDKKRQLNSIVLKHNESKVMNNFPKGHLSQINRKFHNTTFNQETVQQIHDEFEKFGFVRQIKYPEILLTKDTTKVYVYLEKKKSNNFDGFIGFSNSENNKIIFNGYLDVILENTLRAGELFSIYWKSDGNNQKTFKTGIELPYIFKSPIALKATINIFKQDSTFQNTKTAINLGYLIDYNTRLYIGYQSTESSDIQNTKNTTISDYKNSFITSSFEYTKFDFETYLFPKKTNVLLSLGLGNRTTNNLEDTAGESKQIYIEIEAMYNLYLDKKNGFNLRSQNYFLQSDTYITNELYRFGGINSIRGFTENSLQANFMTSIITEYRYIMSSRLYIHTILDYCLYKDQSRAEQTNNTNTLLGVGMGLGLQTKNGLLKLAFASGKAINQKINFYNTIVHICYNIKF